MGKNVLPSMWELWQLTEVEQLQKSNEYSRQYGLTLSQKEIQTLAEGHQKALKENGRVEFGEGVLRKLIRAFCGSPYLQQEEYSQTLFELQDLFYYFKGQAMERLTDDELIAAMRQIFDQPAQGSLDYLAGTGLEELCRQARGGGYCGT